MRIPLPMRPLCSATQTGPGSGARKRGGPKAAPAHTPEIRYRASCLLPAVVALRSVGVSGLGMRLVFLGGELAVAVGVGVREDLGQRRHGGHFLLRQRTVLVGV